MSDNFTQPQVDHQYPQEPNGFQVQPYQPQQLQPYQQPAPQQYYPQPQPQPNIIINNSASAVATAGGYAGPQKSVQTAYILWLLLGALGAHRFYIGKTGSGVLYLFTLGLLGVGLVYDLFTLGGQVRRYNAGVR